MGKKRSKPNFKKKWASLTDIGVAFGFSAVKLGSILKELGLRDPKGVPTEKTLRDGLALATPTKRGHDHYMWDREAIGRILKENGHKRKCDSSDPAHRIAVEIHGLLKQGKRLEAKGEDKMAIFSYDSAVEIFQDALRNAKETKRLNLAVRLHRQLVALTGAETEFLPLYRGGPIPIEAVREQMLGASLPKPKPRNAVPRL